MPCLLIIIHHCKIKNPIFRVYEKQVAFVTSGTVRTLSINEPRHDKTNKMAVRPAKTKISLDIPQSDQSLRCPHEESLGP